MKEIVLHIFELSSLKFKQNYGWIFYINPLICIVVFNSKSYLKLYFFSFKIKECVEEIDIKLENSLLVIIT